MAVNSPSGVSGREPALTCPTVPDALRSATASTPVRLVCRCRVRDRRRLSPRPGRIPRSPANRGASSYVARSSTVTGSKATGSATRPFATFPAIDQPESRRGQRGQLPDRLLDGERTSSRMQCPRRRPRLRTRDLPWRLELQVGCNHRSSPGPHPDRPGRTRRRKRAEVRAPLRRPGHPAHGQAGPERGEQELHRVDRLVGAAERRRLVGLDRERSGDGPGAGAVLPCRDRREAALPDRQVGGDRSAGRVIRRRGRGSCRRERGSDWSS